MMQIFRNDDIDMFLNYDEESLKAMDPLTARFIRANTRRCNFTPPSTSTYGLLHSGGLLEERHPDHEKRPSDSPPLAQSLLSIKKQKTDH